VTQKTANGQLSLTDGLSVPVRARVPLADAVRPHGCTADHAFPAACAFASAGYLPECGGCRWHDADWAVFEESCAKTKKRAPLIPKGKRGKVKKKATVRALLTSD
jgi:hypothetical protein